MGAFGGYWDEVDRINKQSMMIEWLGRIDYSVWEYQEVKIRKGQRAQSEKVEAIAKYILEDEDKEEVIAELRRYRREFKSEPDYNYYRYGTILPYYSQIWDFYKEHGFACNEDNEL